MLKAGLWLCIILFMLLPQARGKSKSSTWSEVKENGSGTLIVAYSENSPFIYNDAQGKMAGIEFEILEEFVQFIHEKYSANNLEY
jgi:membrane-bound lytic murein transglycosylase MltF